MSTKNSPTNGSSGGGSSDGGDATTMKTKMKALASAPPPWHAQFFVVIMLAIFAKTFPSMESIDEVATVETFTRVLFPQYMSIQTMATIRLLFGCIPLCTSISQILRHDVRLETFYMPGSKLIPTKIPFRGYFTPSKGHPHEMVGLWTIMSFTKWSFLLLGTSFLLSGLIPWMVILNNNDNNPTATVPPPPPQWMMRAALLTFEAAGPMTLLVSSVVRYALWPMALKKKSDTGPLKCTRAMFEHNGNAIMALTEVGVLGGLPVRLQHFSVAPLFGILYVLVSWTMANHWATRDKGPQFIYFFFDTTMGWTTTISLLTLLLILSTFYGLFWIASHYISQAFGGIAVNGLAITILASLVCRVRD